MATIVISTTPRFACLNKRTNRVLQFVWRASCATILFVESMRSTLVLDATDSNWARLAYWGASLTVLYFALALVSMLTANYITTLTHQMRRVFMIALDIEMVVTIQYFRELSASQWSLTDAPFFIYVLHGTPLLLLLVEFVVARVSVLWLSDTFWALLVCGVYIGLRIILELTGRSALDDLTFLVSTWNEGFAVYGTPVFGILCINFGANLLNMCLNACIRPPSTYTFCDTTARARYSPLPDPAPQPKTLKLDTGHS